MLKNFLKYILDRIDPPGRLILNPQDDDFCLVINVEDSEGNLIVQLDTTFASDEEFDVGELAVNLQKELADKGYEVSISVEDANE